MIPRQALLNSKEDANAFQNRIERLKQEKVRLMDEWSEAMKRAYRVPVSHRHDVLQTVGQRYSALVDAIESHITTLKASKGEFSSRIEHLLLKTGRQNIN